MFLQVSVCPQGGGIPACLAGHIPACLAGLPGGGCIPACLAGFQVHSQGGAWGVWQGGLQAYTQGGLQAHIWGGSPGPLLGQSPGPLLGRSPGPHLGGCLQAPWLTATAAGPTGMHSCFLNYFPIFLCVGQPILVSPHLVCISYTCLQKYSIINILDQHANRNYLSEFNVKYERIHIWWDKNLRNSSNPLFG